MELGDYYAAYIAMKERKKDWTAYLSRLQDSLVKRMDAGAGVWSEEAAKRLMGKGQRFVEFAV